MCLLLSHTVVCQLGSDVYILSQGQRLTVCVNAVQNNVHCGGKLGICDLVYITQLSFSLCLSLHLSVIHFTLRHTLIHS